MSKKLTDSVNEIHHMDNTIRNPFRAVANASFFSSEISVQEAAWSLLRLLMSFMSHAGMYIPGERTEFIKTEKELRNVKPESEDIFEEWLLDRSEKRPSNIKDVCFAYFAALYICTKLKHTHENE